MREEIKITLSKLTEQVNEGMKLKPLAKHYGIPVSRMGEILKQANLRIRSFRGPQVTLVDDTVQEVAEEDIPQASPSYGLHVEEEVSPEETSANSEEEGSDDLPNLTPNYTF